MNKNITRLQLIDSKVKGFLEIKSNTDTPINLSISDIRDISSRSGMFSKTITLSGTKNNNKILNNYFEVNVIDGTFNVNKKQKVALIQNGVVIKDNCFMRLLKVVKKQNLAANVDDYVEYEVQITDGLGDFFKDISNKELKELTGWESFTHTFNVDSIVDSFSNTVEDGYKYILPHITKGSNGESRYQIGEIMPGIYAKQIFDRIHEQNGMTYEWAKLDHKDFQFDKAIIPYSGDVKKLSEEFIEENKVVVESKAKQHTETEAMLPGGIIVDELIDFTSIIEDITNKFDLANNLYNNSLIISNPDSLVYKVNIDYDIVFVNDGQSDISAPSFNLAVNSGLTLIDDNNTTLLTKYVPAEIDSNYSGVLQNHSSDETYIVITPDVPYNWTPGEHYVAKNKVTDFTLNISELNDTDKISLRIFSSGLIYGNVGLLNWGLKMKIVINSIYVEILPATQNGLLPGADVDLRMCLPSKIKQSEFLKSVYQKYNLYPLPDEDDPNNLIYVTRDEFYDSGEIKDWTDKLAKNQNQELIFLPDITTKKMILSYKDDDKDPVLTAYRDQTLKTFGQVAATFDSENVKGEERKEEIFSPTISLTSDFGAVLPILAPDFKMNIRYLQDGGELGCNNYQINAGGVITNHLSYPFISMFDKPYNPTFSIEYALSDYYAYNIGTPKKNTLYSLHWRRTLSQINEGKMLKAYFHLNEKDVSGLKLNDKIKVNNILYYINKVIDYNANNHKLTKVELLTVEDDLPLPRVGNTVIFNPSVIDLDAELAEGLTPSTPVIDGGFFVESISEVIRKRINSTTVVSRPTLLDGNMGVGNVIPEDFRGIVIGDNMRPTEDGIFIDEISITNGGIFKEDSNGDKIGISLDNDIIEFTGIIDFSNAIVPGLGSMDITPITYTELKDLKTNNSLESGVRYYITDREIWIDALETDKLAMECKRHFRIVKDQFYTPHTDSANNYQGIYGQTIQRGSVPNSGTTVYFAIWGGRMWRRDTTGADVPGISDELIAGGWTMESPTNNTYYESKIFNIKYDFDEDIIWEQSDDRGNIIKRVYSVTSYIDITDWGNTSIFNNECYGIFNNFNNGDIYFNSNSGTIDNNSNGGFIANNSNNGGIYSNSNNGVINRNSNSNDISGNSNDGEIFNNSNDGTIVDNTNSGFIVNNSNNGYINVNSNSGFIVNNSNNGTIYYNSNNGDISVNTNSGSIDNNSNNGSINSNSNNGYIRRNRSDSGSTDIQYNRNNGLIGRNRMNGTYLLEYNNNNGDIGDASNDITRNADITDTTVDK